MAVRLYAEFRSDRGDQYKIEIHDSQWLAVATEFNVDSRGFELTYEGETDDIVSPIIGSRLSFGAYSTNATFETFIETLKSFQENRFRIVVRRISSQDIATDFETRVVTDGGTIESLSCVTDAVNALGLDSYELFWAGWITQDLVNVEDASQPYIYEITATDGIGRLSNIDYTSANTINQNGLKITRLTDVVVDVLNQIGTDDLWGGSDPYLETSVDWWETNSQTYSTGVDPFYNHAFDVRLFHSRDDDGNVVYATGFDVLRQLTTLYNARIYIQRGRFVFEQYGNRDTTSRYVSRYDKTGTSISRLLIADDVDVDQTIVAARRAGNNWDFLPALKNVSVQYVQRFLNPLNAFGVFKFTNTATSYTAGFIAGGVGTQLSFGTFAFTMLVTGPVDPYPVFGVFKIRIRIQDASTGTYYYCNRDFNGFVAANMYDPTIWTTTPGYYYFDLPAFYPLQSSSVTTPLTIVTPDIPVSGELDFELTLHDILDSSNGTQYAYDGIVEHNGIFTFGIQSNGNIVGATTFSSVNNESGIDSALTLELGEINIADGPTQTGHLSVYNGTSWVGTEDWRKGSTGATLPILKLLTNETLALHVRPIEQYNGNVISASLFGQRLLFNATAYLFTSATFTANTDEWNGTLFKIQRLRTAVSELDAVVVLAERTPLSGGTSTLGSSPNDLVAGRVAGMIVIADEKKLGPYEQTATGGRINGTANVTGVATMERTTIIGLESFVDTFAARVTADGGTIESKTCVSDAITTLSGDSLVSLIPTDIAAPLTTAESVTMKKTLDVAEAVTFDKTLDVSGKTSVQTIQLDTAYVPNGEAAGSLFWDPDAGIPAVGTIDGDRIDIGEKSVWYVKNQTGATIAKGAAVYASGTLGSSGQILVAPMIADGTINAKLFLGLVQQPIDDGGDGYVVSLGKVRNVDTSAFADGDVLYVSSSTAGALTATEPAAPRLKLPIAIVVKAAANGTISVRQTAGTYLAESHDVQISSPAENELLARTAEGRWENVELGAILTTTTENPATTEGESFTAVFGDNSGTIMGAPSKWLPVTIGGVNYLMPLYLQP